MIAFARWRVPSESVTVLVSPSRSTAITSSGINLGAEALRLGPHVLHEVGAHDAVGKPGKFSTSVVCISAPPAVTEPSKTSGSSAARAL
jgi:hypothetical protein